MKKVTATITTTYVTGRFYNIEKDELTTEYFTLHGNDPSIPQYMPYDSNLQLLKVLDMSEKHTATYEMDETTFIKFASTTDNYKIGCINRTIGGEVADIIAYNLEYDCIEELTVENATEKKIQKALGDAYKLVKVKEVRKTATQSYYMGYNEFKSLAVEK